MKTIEDVGGLVFDCDGTLLDTLGAWDEAERELFSQAGELTSAQLDEIHSAPIDVAGALFHEAYGVFDSTDAVMAHLEGVLMPYYAEEARLMPGVRDFVVAAFERSFPCVVVSSSPRRYIEAGLRRAGVLECFADIVTTDETRCSKRDPEIYDHALGLLGCERERVVAFDDAPYAIAAMHAFGLKTVCVGGKTSRQADMTIDTFDAICFDGRGAIIRLRSEIEEAIQGGHSPLNQG